MNGDNVRLMPDFLRSTLEQRAALIEWARQNGLDPARIIEDGMVVDLGARVIRYQEYVDEGTPGAWRPGPDAPPRRSATAPLLVDPPPAAFGLPAPRYVPPVGYRLAASVTIPGAAPSERDALAELRALYADLADGPPVNGDWLLNELGRVLRRADEPAAPVSVHMAAPTPPAAFDWERYKRTCDPDRQLDGLGDLCLFLGGTWADPGKGSFIGELLKLIAKADPERLARLAAGFPREVRAWQVWMPMSPSPTAAELCEVLTRADANRRVLLEVGKWPAARAMNDDDIPAPGAHP